MYTFIFFFSPYKYNFHKYRIISVTLPNDLKCPALVEIQSFIIVAYVNINCLVQTLGEEQVRTRKLENRTIYILNRLPKFKIGMFS